MISLNLHKQKKNYIMKMRPKCFKRHSFFLYENWLLTILWMEIFFMFISVIALNFGYKFDRCLIFDIENGPRIVCPVIWKLYTTRFLRFLSLVENWHLDKNERTRLGVIACDRIQRDIDEYSYSWILYTLVILFFY